MLIYGSDFGQNVTFAPNYADTLAAEAARNDAATALWDTTRDLALYRDNSNSVDNAMAEAYERRNKAIFDATGEQLFNPYRGDGKSASYVEEASRARSEGRDAYSLLEDRAQQWQQRAADLARRRPELAAVIAADRPIRQDAAALTRSAETAAAEASARAEQVELGIARSLGNSLGGGVAAMFRDPVQVAGLFAGGGISGPARTVGVRLLQTVLTEAAINAGIEGAIQVASQDWKKEAGVDASVSTSLEQVGLAALFGGGFGGVLQGGREVFRVLGRSVPEEAFSRAAAGEAQPGDLAAIADALGVKADPTALRTADIAAEQRALDRAAFGDPPAGMSDMEAEALAAQAVRAAEAPDDGRSLMLDRLAREQMPVGPAPRRPVSLMRFLASEGGIRDEGGELAGMGLSRRFVPGSGALVRPRGRTLDYAREAAAEAGYLDHIYGNPERAVAESTPDDLLRLLSKEAGGDPVYSAREDGGREFEWLEHEQRQQAQAAYRRLLDDIDTARAELDLGEIDDTLIVRAAELVDDETDPVSALEKALDEDYRLRADTETDLGEQHYDELDMPFFDDRQDAGAMPRAGAQDGSARPGGEPPGERAGYAQDREQLSGAGGAQAEEIGLRQPGDTPEPATPEAGEVAELALVEARRPGDAATDGLEPKADLSVWDTMPAARDADGRILHTTHEAMIADADRSEFFGDLIASCRD